MHDENDFCPQQEINTTRFNLENWKEKKKETEKMIKYFEQKLDWLEKVTRNV